MCSVGKNQGTYRHEEDHSCDGSHFQGRKRSRSSSQDYTDKMNCHYEHRSCVFLSSKLQEDDRNVEMRDVLQDLPVTCTSYAFQHMRVEKQYSEDHIQITMWKNTKPQGQDAPDGTPGNWFKVTIPCGRKYDKKQLMTSIHNLCGVPFTPVDFCYEKNKIRFFVQDASAASALKDISHKMCDEESQKIPIFVSPSDVPYSVQKRFTPEQMEQLKLTMRKRYDVSKQALDLRRIHFDQDLMDHNIKMILNRRSCMVAALQLIQEDFPELLSLNLGSNKLLHLDGLFDVVEKAPQIKILNLSKNELKTAWELEKLRGLKLEELWLEGNPLCSRFPDQSSYLSAIVNCFPNLVFLDGRKVISPIVMDVEYPQLRKLFKDSFKDSEPTKNLILQFLQEYYLIYDYGERHGLLTAYHDQACFSLTIPFNPSDPDLSSMYEYFKDSGDMKIPKDSKIQRQLLKYTKQDIVDYLSELPKTHHAFSSFQVDICFQTETMLCFSVKGMFKELEGSSQECVRAFMRTIIATFGNSSLCIVNDQLFLRNTSPSEIQSGFSVSLSTPCYSSNPILSQDQRRMVQTFSDQSRMKLEWSQKCLEDNKWDYSRAAQVFTMLQTEGKIPKEFFK